MTRSPNIMGDRFNAFLKSGWVRFPSDPGIARWAKKALPFAHAAIADPANRQWMRCGGTWHVGVNALPNGADGTLPDGTPLAGPVIAFAHHVAGRAFDWDPAQVSAVYPGYPRQEQESDAAFAFRRDRDAAHVDGLKRKPDMTRHLEEAHAFILGIPLTKNDPASSPLVVWEGSHIIMREAFMQALSRQPEESWTRQNLTEVYAQARRKCFQSCKRIELSAQPGESYVLHRLSLHGVSPWKSNDDGNQGSRMIAYFRPSLPLTGLWLTG